MKTKSFNPTGLGEMVMFFNGVVKIYCCFIIFSVGWVFVILCFSTGVRENIRFSTGVTIFSTGAKELAFFEQFLQWGDQWGGSQWVTEAGVSFNSILCSCQYFHCTSFIYCIFYNFVNFKNNKQSLIKSER